MHFADASPSAGKRACAPVNTKSSASETIHICACAVTTARMFFDNKKYVLMVASRGFMYPFQTCDCISESKSFGRYRERETPRESEREREKKNVVFTQSSELYYYSTVT